jgi:recombination protein RecT
MADQGTAVATHAAHPLVQFKNYMEQRSEELRIALPSHISPEKFQRTMLTAIQETPDLLQCDRKSLWVACLKCANDGLMPDKREAVILPFKQNKKDANGAWQTTYLATYIPMVFGIRKKILQSGEVAAIDTGVVYKIEAENGYFRYEKGTEPPLNHQPMLEISAEEATDDKIVGAYSIAIMKDGTKSYEFMRRFEIDKVRETSQTGATRTKKGEPRNPSGPWVEWFPEQCKKTALKRHSKVLPQSTDVTVERSDHELTMAASVAAMISRVKDDEPTLLTDETGTQFDRDTGEVHEEENTQEASGTAREAPGAEESTSAKSDTVDASATGPASDDASTQANSDDSDEDDNLIEGRVRAEEDANRILGEMSDAGNVIALKRVYDSSQLELTGLPEDLAAAVESGYDRSLKRLGTTRALVAKVVAKANSEKAEA